ncbi:MAG: AAA family ATPase [Jiangellaceae bacterium]
MALLERHAQLAELAAAQQDAATARGSLVLVTGEAGVGKTVLVQRFAGHSKARVLWGLCDDLVTPRPLGPFRDMFAHLNTQPDLAAFLDAVVKDLAGHTYPTVAVVEDAHWADRATLDAIRFLGRRISRMRALLVVTYRDDEVPADHPLRLTLGAVSAGDTRRVRLAPLSEAAVATLARGSRVDAGKLYELTGGNPFYVSESLADPESSVPLSVQDAVMARVGRLGELGRACAELVSTIPGAAELWLLEACEVSDGLDEAVRLGVLRPGRDVVTFSHELARRAVEQSLAAARREHVNGLILDALAARDADPARLTHHAVQARRAAAVSRYAPLAAQRAAAIGADREAFEHYRRALDHAERYPTLELLDLLDTTARSGLRSAQIDDAYAPATRAVGLCRASGDQVRLGGSLCLLSEIEWCRGNGSGAQAAADEAIAVLEGISAGTEELVAAYAQQARLAMLDHRIDATLAWGEKAFALVGQRAGAAPPADLLVTVGTARVQRSADDAEMLVEALHTALDGHHVHAASRAYINLADERTLHMRYGDALRFIEDGLTYLETHDLLAAIDHMLAVRARWHLDQGRWSEAERDAAQTTDAEAPSRTMTELVIGLIRARRGDPSAAATLDNVARRAEAAGEAQQLVPVALARAELAWLAGDHTGVTAALEPVLPIVLPSGCSRWIGEAALWQHRVGTLDETPDGAAEPYALQIAGRWREAAAAWAALDRPYDQADALADAPAPEPLLEALTILDRHAAMPRAAMVRRRLTELGVGSVPRGPRAPTRASPAGLTPRQTEVLTLLADQLTYQAIADRLHVSIKTVDHHVTAIRHKLGAGTRDAAVEAARRLGILA